MRKRINYYFDTDISCINASIVNVMKMCQAFEMNGYDVTLFCTGNPKKIKVEDILKKYGIETSFEVKMVDIPNYIWKYGHRLAQWYAAWKRTKIPAEEGVVYARSMMSLFFLKEKIQYVFEAHGEPDMVNRQFERSIIKNKNCKGVVVISQALKKRYMELFPFLTEDKIMVLHDAANVEDTELTDKAELQGSISNINIGYVGSLLPGKCMETLLPLAKLCSQYHFHIVGGTEYWINHWKEKMVQQGVKNVFFYGYIDNSKLGGYYRAFDLCILPFSREIYLDKKKRVDIGQWTSPLKLFEAMAYGKPIVVSRLETIEEVMVDGEDCLMVEPDNMVEWVQKLNILIADVKLQKKIGNAAYEKLKREYTWLERAKKVDKLFA